MRRRDSYTFTSTYQMFIIIRSHPTNQLKLKEGPFYYLIQFARKKGGTENLLK